MGQQVTELTSRFNDTLERYRKAESWFDDPAISEEEKDKHYPKLIQITRECGKAEKALTAIGFTFTREQLLNGIKYPDVGRG